MSIEGLAEELENATPLLAAGRQDRPDPFTPALSARTTRSLRDMTVDHDVPNRLFGLIVRWLNPRRRQEAKVIVRLGAAKPLGEVPGLPAGRRPPDHLEEPASNPIHRPGKPDGGQGLGSMPGLE